MHARAVPRGPAAREPDGPSAAAFLAGEARRRQARGLPAGRALLAGQLVFDGGRPEGGGVRGELPEQPQGVFVRPDFLCGVRDDIVGEARKLLAQRAAE